MAGTGTPWHLWAVGTAALLFNAIGVVDFTMSRLQGPAYMQASGMTAAQIAHYQAMPAWMIGVWGIGVFAAFGASLLLALRRRRAGPVFVLSLAAFLLGILYHHVLTDGAAAMGSAMVATDALIAVLLLALIGYSRWMTRRGVLR